MIVIAINGASASGKSFFSQQLLNYIEQKLGEGVCQILTEDNYYHTLDDQARDANDTVNFDHPEAFEHNLLLKHLKTLKIGEPVDVPVYCFKNHVRTEKTQRIKPCQLLIVEGIHSLTNEDLRTIFDIKVFIETPLDICLARRIIRDVDERGRSAECVINQYIETVRPMYLEFIQHNRDNADLVIEGHQSIETMLSLFLENTLVQSRLSSLL